MINNALTPTREYAKFALAYELKMTVRQLERNMTEWEFNHWPAFFAVKNELEKE